MPEPKTPSRARRRARELCLRGLYRAEVTGDSIPEVIEAYKEDPKIHEEIKDYGIHLMSLVHTGLEDIDSLLKGALSRWSLERLAVTDRCVLRMATAEMVYEMSVPTEVILDESIEIAKRFGSPKSGKFVNGVLDGVAKTARNADD
ncbi:MAG: transcription antitermination factor NusB [Candidatus Eisenbacteria bacterium]|uniref:Transcription antitermination protein NusB n=1 Tax=Eiseniibacteriota bacterium TaxID=2212470 RepID=A0A7Y2H326_UNCEI|nr:transcription antitermination factor NusB [Candidatus Eisenbacteria bacterium]